MKANIIAFGFLICSLSSFGQWTLVKKFNKSISFIESTQQGLVVSTDSSYYIQQDPNNWTKFSLNNKILDMESKGDIVFFATSKEIYEHLTNPIKVHELNNGNTFKSINIYKGKKLVSLTGFPSGFEMFCTFTNSFGQFDTLDYSTTKSIWPLQTISSDDNYAIIGYSNYFGAKTFNEQTKYWIGISGLESQVVCDTYINNQIIMARISKGGTDFYFSNDYGLTYKKQTNVFPFLTSSNSVMEYSNGNSFIGFGDSNAKGVYQSSDNGQVWNNILADSIITGIAVNGNDLFVTTNKGSLLKTTIIPKVTSVDENEFDMNLYYSNKTIYNNSTEQVEFTIYDLTGKKITNGIIESSNHTFTNLKEGMYLLEYRQQNTQKRDKIYVW
jgi:hypothetical protein